MAVTSLVEIGASGVSKAAMLADFAAELDIPAAETIAFGDSLNDLPMLAWAGTSYGDGERARRRAGRGGSSICPANDEDGVATVLEELFDL